MKVPAHGPGRWEAIVLALLCLAALAPQLAVFPQSGDGAELLLAAQRGGVLHPPGFPFQAWLDRLVAAWPAGTLTLRISMISWLAHGAAVGLLADALRIQGVSRTARVFAALGFAFYPPMSYLAVQPEVFGLAHFFLAVAIYQAAISARACAVGLGAGLALAQHPICLLALPLFAVPAAADPRGPRRGLALAALIAGGIVAAAYLSLPALRTGSAWPDWGHLQRWTDTLRHALRMEYGIFDLQLGERGVGIAGGAVFGSSLLATGFVAWFALALIGLWPGHSESRRFRTGLAAMLVLGLLLVLRTKVRVAGDHPLIVGEGEAVLRRFQGGLVLAACALAGFGLDRLLIRLRQRPRKWLTLVLPSLAILYAFAGREATNARADRVPQLYSRAMGLELPADALFLATGDFDVFYGATLPTGGVRTPIASGLLQVPWYVTGTVPRLDPRFHPTGPNVGIAADLVKSSILHGISVATPDPSLLGVWRANAEPRGVLYLLDPTRQSSPSDGASDRRKLQLAAAIRLCPLLAELKSYPPVEHGSSRVMLLPFAVAWQGAAEELRRLGKRDAAERAQGIALALAETRDLSRVHADCAEFERVDSGARTSPSAGASLAPVRSRGQLGH